MKTVFTSLFALFALCLTVTADESPFAGTWDTNWGDLIIQQDGEKFTGSYQGQFTGTITGSVKGGKLHFIWKQPNAEWGSGAFSVSEDGTKLTGTWGSAKSETNGGPWTGTKK